MIYSDEMGVGRDILLACNAECIAYLFQLCDGLWLVVRTFFLLAHSLAEALCEQHLQVMSLSLAALAHEVVHIVPTGWELVFLR